MSIRQLKMLMAAVTMLAAAGADAQDGSAGKVAPKLPEATVHGNVLSPPDSKSIPVGVDKVNPAPRPFPSEFAKPPVEFRLWENGGAPGNPEALHKGQLASKKGAAIMNWGIPSIVVWEPLKAGTNRKAIMLCPGGAYQNICTDWRPQVDGFLQDGYVVFMLKYRTVPGSEECEKYSLMDAKRAIRFIRTYAPRYGIDTDRIGVAGSSAGSNLVLNLITHPDAGNPKDEDILERPGTQVAFAAMLSPWFPGKRRVGDYPIGKDTPPSFIATAKDDTGAPTSWAVSISDAYGKAGVPHFLFQIEKGNHGAFDTSKPDAEVSNWRTLFMEWLGKTLPESKKSSQP
ncbi:MAG TPA: hypothetical protein DET40_01135 [Lentisphaeria bacterium]|nr:hypothetical protein [Lentisphaeria bacterium]